MAARSYRALCLKEPSLELTQYGFMSRPSRGKYTTVFSLVLEKVVKWNRFK
jgi:hypothetical protein